MQSLFYFLLALALLIIIHEYGHFWVARRCGVKVLRFSVGFGKPLWRKVGKDGTEYVLAPIPLGGYVKMLDEREADVAEHEKAQAFNRQSLSKRTAIVAAGPIANLSFAVLAYWVLFVTGIPGLKPVIAEIEVDSPAMVAGLVQGDEIISIDGQNTPTWNAVIKAMVPHIQDGSAIAIGTKSEFDETRLIMNLPKLDLTQQRDLLTLLGITPLIPDFAPIIGQVVDGGAADSAGIKSGDRVISADGQAIQTWRSWVAFIQARPGQPISVSIERDGLVKEVVLEPELTEDGKGRIGAGVDSDDVDFPEALQAEVHYGPLTAVKEAIQQTWLFSSTTLTSLWGMLTGQVSTENLGGPISIAQMAGSSAEQGYISFISFLAMISITLGILNLLPIPMLDGGHLVMFLVEAVTGKPVPDHLQIKGQQIGLFILLTLMFIAFYNDLSRLFG